MDVLHWAWASVKVFGECAMRRIAFYSFVLLIVSFSLMSRSIFWHFDCFSFRMWNCPRCMHIHAIDPWADPSVAMHRVVRLFFLLCLVPVSEQLASIEPLAENCSKLKLLNAIHSMRRGAGRGQPSGTKQLPLSLGFKCAYCKSEFDSRIGMDTHRRHSASVGTPCADPRNSKSMSLTARGEHSFAGILRQHDTLGVLPIPAFQFLLPGSENAVFAYWE